MNKEYKDFLLRFHEKMYHTYHDMGIDVNIAMALIEIQKMIIDEMRGDD